MSGVEPLRPAEAARSVGLTTTIPVEAVFAAGLRPVDLNNVFITSAAAPVLIEEAERRGFPRNSCSWNKGVYAAALRLGLRRCVAVVQGDCANAHATAEMLTADGVEIIPFAYPYDPRDAALMNLALDRFCAALGTTRAAAEEWKARLDAIRALAHRIDEMCWREDRVGSEEQHVMLISTSDFFGDPQEYRRRAETLIAQAAARPPRGGMTRLALIGIPPICGDFFAFLEERNARVVFNEIPRQFAMPAPGRDLAEQYANYTYPYDIFVRLRDIETELARRRVDGVIHYVQSFCFRQVQDAIIRRHVKLPILTLECDRPGPVDAAAGTRIEAFLEILQANR